MRKLFLFLFFICFSSIYANSSYIEFDKKQTEDPFHGKYSYKIWSSAFNYAPEFASFFYNLKAKYKISTAVETGTSKGLTTTLFSLLFDNVHTIEIKEATYQTAKANLSSFTNIRCHLGSSEQVLETLLPTLGNQTLLFYLDAHWNNYWPLRDELEVISRTHKDNCIVVIDDIKVPGRPEFPFDKYKNHECSLLYVQDVLSKVYSQYDYFYLLPNKVSSKAKLIVFPKSWNFQP